MRKISSEVVIRLFSHVVQSGAWHCAYIQYTVHCHDTVLCIIWNWIAFHSADERSFRMKENGKSVPSIRISEKFDWKLYGIAIVYCHWFAIECKLNSSICIQCILQTAYCIHLSNQRSYISYSQYIIWGDNKNGAFVAGSGASIEWNATMQFEILKWKINSHEINAMSIQQIRWFYNIDTNSWNLRCSMFDIQISECIWQLNKFHVVVQPNTPRNHRQNRLKTGKWKGDEKLVDSDKFCSQVKSSMLYISSF